MNNLTDDDKKWGPFTWARWNKTFEIALNGGDEEDPENTIFLCGFGWALRIEIPGILKNGGEYSSCCDYSPE